MEPFKVARWTDFVSAEKGRFMFSNSQLSKCYMHLVDTATIQETVTLELKGFGAFGKKTVIFKVGSNLRKALSREGLWLDVFPIHDPDALRDLKKTWALCWWGGFSQPLEKIRSYFGSEIGLYFAFLGMYTKWLLPVAAAGFASWLYSFKAGRADHEFMPIYALITAVWASLFLEAYKRQMARLTHAWLIDPTKREVPTDLPAAVETTGLMRQVVDWSVVASIIAFNVILVLVMEYTRKVCP
jgi:anoctamin-10